MDGTRSEVHEKLSGSLAAMSEMALKQDYRIAQLSQNIAVRISVFVGYKSIATLCARAGAHVRLCVC